MIAGRPLDPRLLLGLAEPIWLRFETEAPVDDLMIGTSEGGFVAIQAKTSLSLSQDPQGPFAKTIAQFVRHWLACRDGLGDRDWNRPLNPSLDRLVLAVSPRAPASIREDLPAALRGLSQPGARVPTQAQARALTNFRECTLHAWGRLSRDEVPQELPTDLARLIVVFTIDPDGADGATTDALLSTVVTEPRGATSARDVLSQISGRLMAERGGIDVVALREALFTRGARLVALPRYHRDILTLKEHSEHVIRALTRFEEIEIEHGRPVGIQRDCQAAVEAAARQGSLLVVGEPGSGKSGVLNALAKALTAQRHDVLVLAVDRFSVETLEGLAAALRLEHSLLDVLQAWDGPEPAWLIIDALDATRGGRGEGVFRALIESIAERATRWHVIASIRTFDLRMGQQFRALFKGSPPDPTLTEPNFPDVRHVRIPVWSTAEFERLTSKAPALKEALAKAPPRLRELVAVPFNTRLISDLLADDVVAASLSAVTSQAELLHLFWSHRVERYGYAGERCLRHIVTAMVNTRSLRASLLEVLNPDPSSVEGLVRDGVLIEVEGRRWIQFRHHLLFDYAAGRVFLDPSTLVSGERKFPKAEGLGLMLAPALSFVLQELWSSENDHRRFWDAAIKILADASGDPVIRSSVARVSSELPMARNDTECLGLYITDSRRGPMAQEALPHIISALVVHVEDNQTVAIEPWAHLARILSENVAIVAPSLRMLGYLFVERARGLPQEGEMGVVARSLMNYGLTLAAPSFLMSAAIEFVAITYGSNPTESCALLRRLFEDQRFDQYGFEEIPALTRKIAEIASIDPAFAAEIYREAYSRTVSTERSTVISGGQIMPLRSNARQDYDMARYSLAEFFPLFLEKHPSEAIQALVEAVGGFVKRQHPVREAGVSHNFSVGGEHFRLTEDQSYVWAHEPDSVYHEDAMVLIAKLRVRLESLPDPEALALGQELAKRASLALLWARLFMTAAARGGSLVDFLWPLAAKEPFLVSPDTRKDAIDVLTAGLERRTLNERTDVEMSALGFDFSAFTQPALAKASFLQRLFAAIGLGRLQTGTARHWLASAPDGSQVENERLFVIETAVFEPPPFSWVDAREAGEQPNASLIAAIQKARDAVGLDQRGRESIALTLDASMAALQQLHLELDANPAARADLRECAEGVIGQVCNSVLEHRLLSGLHEPEKDADFVASLEVAARSASPRVESDTEARFEHSAVWSSPASRVEAAQGVFNLCMQRPDLYQRVSPLIEVLSIDRHPAVRLQAGLGFVRLWGTDRAAFWRLTEQRLSSEANTAVLDHLASSLLARVVHHAPDRTEALVLSLLCRLEADDTRAQKLREHMAAILAVLWVKFGLEGARRQIANWVEYPADRSSELRRVLAEMRAAFVQGIEGEETRDVVLRKRAHDLAAAIVIAANHVIAAEATTSKSDENPPEAAQRCAQLVDFACQQLYFAIQQTSPGQARTIALNENARRRFFNEAEATLFSIGDFATPHTIYYLLQLIESVASIEPARAFDVAARALLRGGSRSGYQQEFLGASLLVRLVGVFLADHKAIFEDDARRSTLIDCLGLFMEAGWPAARRLLYRLPELIQ